MESGQLVGASSSSTSTATVVASPIISSLDKIMQAPAADVDSRRGDGPGRAFICPELYEAATSGNTDRLLELLNPSTIRDAIHCPCSLSEVTVERNTVLHLAAGLGHMQLAKETYSRERSLLMAENSRGDTPLHRAARAGCGGVVSLLLQLAEEYGVEANEVLVKKNLLGDTALYEAVRNGHEEVAEVMMNKAPQLASMYNAAGVSPLYLAVMNGSIPLVSSLIRPDTAFTGPKGQTALHAAVRSSKEIASLLLKWKPRIAEEVDASRSTPLHYAASSDDAKVVQMLLDASTSATYFKDTEGFSPIHIAASAGNLKTIELLLRACPDSAELLENKGRNFLHLAAEKNRVNVVEYVLKPGKKELEKLINEQDSEGNTPLHLAVESDNSLVAVALGRDGRTRKNVMNNMGQTPLELASKIRMFLPSARFAIGFTNSGVGLVPERDLMCSDLYEAATSGNTDGLLKLLDPAMDKGVHGACRLSETTAERNTVLHLAAGRGHKELVKTAYTRERSLMMAENSRGNTPFHCAARAGHGSVLSALLQLAGEHGVEANEVLMKKNWLGDTALHDAVRNGHEEVAKVLINKAPDLASMANEDGVSPLYLAATNGSVPTVESLIQCDNASFAGPKGQTALHAAVFSSKKVASILLNWKPALAQIADASGSTPLYYVASAGDEEVVKMLLDAPTSATYSRDMEGFSPIHVAARVGNLKTIRLLLKTCPASAELLDNKGRNFLHHAAEKNKIKVVEYVLEHGKKFEKLINEQDSEGNTPLHLAIESENSMIALKLSLDKRVQTSIMNRQGKTPLEQASMMRKILPLAFSLQGLINSGATFSARRQDQIQPWNSKDSKKWYDTISKNLAIVSVLIATVAFSATFNVPGGYNSDSGKATLHGDPKFNFFMILDSLAMAFSLVSTILLILVRLLEEHSRSLLFSGIFTLWLAIFFMNSAFTIAALSVGIGSSVFYGIVYVAYFIFYIPSCFILFRQEMILPLLRQFRGPRVRLTTYIQSRTKQQYGEVTFFYHGLRNLGMISFLGAVVILFYFISTRF